MYICIYIYVYVYIYMYMCVYIYIYIYIYIWNVVEEWGFILRCGGAPLPSEPVSQYRCVNLPKTDDND